MTQILSQCGKGIKGDNPVKFPGTIATAQYCNFCLPLVGVLRCDRKSEFISVEKKERKNDDNSNDDGCLFMWTMMIFILIDDDDGDELMIVVFK